MCDTCDYSDMLDEMSSMLEDEDYKGAFNYLKSVSNWVETNRHITPAQRDKVLEIRDERWK